MTQQNTATTFIAMLLFLVAAGALSSKPSSAAAKAAPKTCTNQPQAGIAQVLVGEDGYSLTLVPLAAPFCGPYSVVITPQGSESAVEDIQTLFDIERYFVDTHELNAFVIGAKGEPNAAAYFQWIAHPRTQ